MNSTNGKKWKSALLKTSLPLEYLVGKKLEKKHFSLWGEFPYARKNEQGVETEFSVDIRAFDLLRRSSKYWATLDLLVECKYNHPTVRWVFSPHPENAPVVIGVISVLEELCTTRIDNSAPVYSVDGDLPFCVKGIELHDSDANEQSISRGLHQLRWAIPELAIENIRGQATTNHEEDLHISFICPILVTNAPLYVLNETLTLKKVRTAESLEAIATKVEALVVYQARGPQLDAHLRDHVRKLHENVSSIRERLDALWPLAYTANERKYLSSEWKFSYALDTLSTRILVVNFDSLDEMVRKIRGALQKAGKNLKRVGKLERDVNNLTARIEPHSRRRSR